VVTVALAATCPPNAGTSVATVHGSELAFPQFPILLVTSCFAAGGSKSAVAKRSSLYFLDPATGNVVKTIQTKSGTTTFAPGNGWAQLALRPNKGDLLGCGDDGSLYAIDYSVFSSTADGTITAITKPAAVSIASCVGLAWDASNNSIYMTIGGTIFHFDTSGASVSGSALSFAAPVGCTATGLSVVGGVLLVACGGGGTVYRLDKLTGAPLAANPTITFSAVALADLECDPVSFGLSNIDVMWSKSAATDQVMAYRVPAAMCGLPPTATVLAPAACPADQPQYWTNNDPVDGAPKDSDGDGLWDCWEDPARWADGRPGIDFDSDGVRDLVLCAAVDTNGDGIPDTTECANPLVKDIFVEIDYMQNADGTSSHLPDPLGLLAVRTVFLSAPVNVPLGIRLHFLVNEAMPHHTNLALEPCTVSIAGAPDAVDFDALKAIFFGTATERSGLSLPASNPDLNPQTLNAKRMAFRYMIFGHALVASTSSGCSELPGDDSAITLGGFGPADSTGHKRGTTDQQAGTVMHELGHTLGLRHGGGDNANCKPNYLSVMSYSRQFTDFITNRVLDYSRAQLSTLNESSLSETSGIGTSPSDVEKTVYGVPLRAPQVVTLPQPLLGTGIDWNLDGTIATVSADINKLIPAGCDGSNAPPAGNTTLAGYNDWVNLQYNARASLDFAAGARTTTINTPGIAGENTEKTDAQELASFLNADHDGDGTPDAFACGFPVANPPTSATACVIDIKPGDNPKVISKSQQSNIQVALFATATFDPVTQVLRETLTLNEVGVKLNNNNKGTCSTNSTNGRLTLLCQFPTSALPLGTNFSILEGRAVVSGKTVGIRARDAVTVVK